MAKPTSTNLNPSDVSNGNVAPRTVGSSDKQFRVQFLNTAGTAAGVAGVIEGSYSNLPGTFTELASIREKNGALFNNVVGAGGFAVVGNCSGYTNIQFRPTAISAGPIAVNIDTGTTFDLPVGAVPISVGSQSQTIISASANAFTVGPNGLTNPAFNVDGSASSAATGWGIVAAAAASGAALTVLSSGSAENGSINAKGTGTLSLQNVATGAISLGTATSVTGTITGTSSNAKALAVGLNGATNPALQVDASTASSATGLKVKSAAAAGGLALSVITSGTNEPLTLDSAGSGTITLNGTGTGNVVIGSALAFGSDSSAAKSIVVGTTNGLKIGTGTTQKIGFFNATPVVQQNTTGTTTGFTAATGAAVLAGSTFTGNSGSTAYTVGDLVFAMKSLGLLAA